MPWVRANSLGMFSTNCFRHRAATNLRRSDEANNKTIKHINFATPVAVCAGERVQKPNVFRAIVSSAAGLAAAPRPLCTTHFGEVHLPIAPGRRGWRHGMIFSSFAWLGPTWAYFYATSCYAIDEVWGERILTPKPPNKCRRMHARQLKGFVWWARGIINYYIHLPDKYAGKKSLAVLMRWWQHPLCYQNAVQSNSCRLTNPPHWRTFGHNKFRKGQIVELEHADLDYQPGLLKAFDRMHWQSFWRAFSERGKSGHMISVFQK